MLENLQLIVQQTAHLPCNVLALFKNNLKVFGHTDWA